MENQEAKILSESITEEIDEFINKAKKIKKIISSFTENVDILSEEYSDKQVATIFRNIDIKISDMNSLLSILLSDSKKLESFLHEIKLLKRKREKRLNKDKNDKSLEMDLDKLLEKFKKYKPEPYISPYNPPYNPGTTSPGTHPGTTTDPDYPGIWSIKGF